MSARRAVFLDASATGPRAREGSALAGSLTARGFALERFADPRAVLVALSIEPAEVLIVDADSPTLDMREFVEALRRDPRTAHTLVVALASGDPRDLPARREIALTLAKPINADEAASRLEGLVITRQRAATNARELRGDLAQLALPDLLQLLAVSRASGTLTVDAPGRRGSLALDNGELHDVLCGPATGLKAFVRLLMLTEGAFVFTHGPVEAPAGGGEVLALGPALFEATRQTDEIARLREALPEPWVEVRRRPHVPPSAELAERIAASTTFGDLARLLEVPRPLGALLDASPATDADLLEALDVFRREGLLEIAGAEASDRATVLDGSYAAALAARLTAAPGRRAPRVLLLVDPTPGAAETVVARSLAGIAGFVPTEGALAGPLPLGPLGVLLVNDARLEVFGVPAEREMYPLWCVFGAHADAAVVAADFDDAAGPGPQAFATEARIPVACVQGALSPQTLAAALRAALEQLIPRR